MQCGHQESFEDQVGLRQERKSHGRAALEPSGSEARGTRKGESQTRGPRKRGMVIQGPFKPHGELTHQEARLQAVSELLDF